ncbi:arylesterase [Sphingomonas sp. ID1715]|uniref:arylesterase n=1 Tax=Sphingomonas sp. ID1715 TaxID=1656898 RepID=UPI001489EBAF|nr:arylesterase [Sphingomonas sp. ID1715]NNM77925.1 arylesterase [Sphingomonas sp. ID1715]
MKEKISLSFRLRTYGAALIFVQLAGCGGRDASTNDTQPATQAAAPAASPRPGPAKGKLILAFGDSLYAGYGVAQGESFPAELEKALNKSGLPATVHNGGVSGDTTAAGRQRLAFTLDGLARKPDLVLLGLGGNDMLRGLPIAETEANLRAMLDELKRRGIPVILTGMLAAPNMGRDYVSRFDALYPKLAKEYAAGLYPFFLDGVVTNPRLMLADRIHPNPAGIDRIVEGIAPLVEQRLQR